MNVSTSSGGASGLFGDWDRGGVPAGYVHLSNTTRGNSQMQDRQVTCQIPLQGAASISNKSTRGVQADGMHLGLGNTVALAAQVGPYRLPKIL